MSAFERIVELRPAYDRLAEGYGIHGVDLLMLLKGSEGVTSFLLFTGWLLPATLGLEQPDSWHLGGWGPFYSRGLHARATADLTPMPADLGYHSRTPRYDGQESMGACEYLDGDDCYYEGSGLNAVRVFDTLLHEGSVGVWRELEAYYARVFTPEAVT